MGADRGRQEGPQKEEVAVLKRLLAYAEKVFSLGKRFATCRDGRRFPRYSAPCVARAAFTAVLAKLGSLHAFAPCTPRAFLRRFIGGATPSDDTIGRVMDTLDLQALRDLLVHLYWRRRRNKSLKALPDGRYLLVIDGHEGRRSRRRKWPGCITRHFETPTAAWEEYFPGYVVAQLVGRDCSMVLDLERLGPKEGELTAADRLLKRLLKRLPRAFDIVMGDALYASGPFWKTVRQAGKYLVTVLKQEDRALMEDARALWETLLVPPVVASGLGETAQYWDVTHLSTWPQAGEPVRAVRADFVRCVRRQRDRTEEVTNSQWVWVTTLPASQYDAAAVARLGRLRWTIENLAFNDLVHEWHADHIYRCSASAAEGFLLLACIAQTLFSAFYRGNLKPALRARVTARGVGDILRGEVRMMAVRPQDSS